jgi:hypothetical protein
MNNSFSRLIDGMCATLRTEVLTRLDDEFARGQVFGVINLLNTFKVRADWSVGFLSQQVQVQCDTLNQVAQLLSACTDAPALPPRQGPQPITAAQLEAMRDDANRDISKVLVWLPEHGKELGPDVSAEVERLLRQSMHTEIAIELKNSPRPLFAEMSSGQET